MSTAFNVIATLIAKPGQQATLETLLRGLLSRLAWKPVVSSTTCTRICHPETFYMLERWSATRPWPTTTECAYPGVSAKAADVIEHFELKRLSFLPDPFFLLPEKS